MRHERTCVILVSPPGQPLEEQLAPGVHGLLLFANDDAARAYLAQYAGDVDVLRTVPKRAVVTVDVE